MSNESSQRPDVTADDHGELDAWNESDARNLPEKIGPSPYPPEPAASQRPRKENAGEWTYKHELGGGWHVYPGTKACGAIVATEGQAKAICDAHNAALTAKPRNNTLANMELEIINKLYLELSQIATARTAKEIALVDALERIIGVASGYAVGSKLSITSRLASDALAKVSK